MNGKTAMDAYTSALSMMPYWLEFLEERERDLEAQLAKARGRATDDPSGLSDLGSGRDDEDDEGAANADGNDREHRRPRGESVARSEDPSPGGDESGKPDFLRE